MHGDEWVRRLVHVSETSGSRSLEAGGLAALSLGSQRLHQCSDSSRSDSGFWGPPSLSLPNRGRGMDMAEIVFRSLLSAPFLRSLDVLGFPHSVRHGLS